MARTIDEDELIELAGKRGSTRLAFGLMLKFHQRHGRFPRSRAELPDGRGRVRHQGGEGPRRGAGGV